MSTICQRLYHRKYQHRGVGGQKSQNLVNVVCERPLGRMKEIIRVSLPPSCKSSKTALNVPNVFTKIALKSIDLYL